MVSFPQSKRKPPDLWSESSGPSSTPETGERRENVFAGMKKELNVVGLQKGKNWEWFELLEEDTNCHVNAWY